MSSTVTIHEVIAALTDIEPLDANNTLHVFSACDTDLTDGQLRAAAEALLGLRAQARAWNWGAVGEKLDRAYSILGHENPGDGNDFHRGVHPAQQYMQ